MTPALFAALFALACAGGFLAGLRIFRMAEPPGGTTVEQAHRFGRLLMMASTALFLFLVAVIVHGDLGVFRAARAIQ
jgi:hypothetical protein